jgi:hypothetical protein
MEVEEARAVHPPGRTTPTSRRTRQAIGALLLALGAPLLWWATLDVPSLRASGAAAWIALAASIVIGGSAAWVDRRVWVRTLASVEVLLLALFAWIFFGLAKLPEARAAETLERAADFTLLDSTGTPHVLSEELLKGPVLLVFFRGSW